MKLFLSAFAAVLAGCSSASAESRWTEFRGPSGSGHSDSTGLPREWAEGQERGLEDGASTAAAGRPRWCSENRSGSPPPPWTGKVLSVLALGKGDGRVLFDQKVFDVAEPAGYAPVQQLRLAHSGDRGRAGLRPLRKLRDCGPRHRDRQGPVDAPGPPLQPLAGTRLVADPLPGPPHRPPGRLRRAVCRGPRQEDGPDGVEGPTHPRLRHRRRRPEEGVRDPDRDRGRRARRSSSAPRPRPSCRSIRSPAASSGACVTPSTPRPRGPSSPTVSCTWTPASARPTSSPSVPTAVAT